VNEVDLDVVHGERRAILGPNKPAPGRNYPPCVKRKLPWLGKIKVVKNGVITNQVIR